MCATYDESEGARASFLVSMEVVGPGLVFVDKYMISNKDRVGLLKCSELQRHVE